MIINYIYNNIILHIYIYKHLIYYIIYNIPWNQIPSTSAIFFLMLIRMVPTFPSQHQCPSVSSACSCPASKSMTIKQDVCWGLENADDL